ncbi:alpha/beta-hydrolase [Auriculariales sp. MPI-PUGE-AT-0066]|nr:alpha/beta-hydrolase [Auriculariales sp. MPI-PUGE-AT-0066]
MLSTPSILSLARLLAVVSSVHAIRWIPRQETGDPAPFDWKTVTPNTDLKTLVPCYDAFQCGTLTVPLDYSRTDGPNATIAVTILPATDKANYKGSILINPGGPGGSGTQAVLGLGPLLAPLVGPGYDIVGFDPRGTGESLPSAKCFDAAEWRIFEQNEIFPMESREAVAHALAHDEVIAAKCAEKLLGTGKGSTVEEVGGGRFMDTGSVANDMLSIVHALGQEKLNYLGVSYGTILGQHFAAMHPDKVGLMVIDGVADAVLWRSAKLTTEMQNSDNVFDAFVNLCTKTGKSVCPIAEKNAEKTLARVHRILAAVKAQPIPIVPHANGFHVATYEELRAFVRTQMYFPLAGFPEIAAVLAAAETRNITALHDFAADSPDTGLPGWFSGDQALQAISCVDFPDLSSTTLDEAWSFVRNTSNYSWSFGSIMARVKTECIPWKIRPQNPYTGSFGAEKLSGKLLVASNVYDPITPLADARAVVKRFPAGESALLVQNSIGHCVALNMGQCAAEVFGKFFQTGELPKSGTICQPDELPFVGNVTVGIEPNFHL